MIDDQIYNRFARALSEKIRARAKGIDDDSARIVNTRPQEHVLSCFLTPRGQPAAAGHSDDNVDDVDDLPKDSAFELSSIGLEFMVDRTTLESLSTLAVTIALNVYVRVLPTWQEQRQYGAWQRDRNTGAGPATKSQALAAAWKRISLPPFSTDVDVRDLVTQRRQSIDISNNLHLPASDAADTTLFSARHNVTVTEAELATETSFAPAALRAHGQPHPSPWRACIDVRTISAPTEPDHLRLAIRLINDTPLPARTQIDFVDSNLYAIALSLTLPKTVHRPTVFQELPASFRYDRLMPGVGINAHVDCEDHGSQLVLHAEGVPITETPRLEAREFDDADPTFEALAIDPIPVLEALARHMDSFDRKQWASRISTLSGLERADAETSRQEFRDEIARYKRGVSLLRNGSYPQVLRAFCLMNQSMRAANRAHQRWRLFQIAFIVSLLPELASREYSALKRDDDGRVDLLWFAAGGGKTEAFIGIILWQAFFDRLRGKRFGNTAFVRFPLRLLTFQQLQRLARSVACADVVRREAGLKGARFSIGYLVGGTVTPNRIDDELHRRFVRSGVDPKFKRIFSCPLCGGPVTVAYNEALRLIEHHCATSSCETSKERLPIYVTDHDIYRFLPTAIVSTVDKLALLGQNQRFPNFFGRIDLICGVHGASFGKTNELCDAATAFSRGERPPTCSGKAVHYPPFHDLSPAILVQDELHLLNEELGTFDAHYETGVMALMQSLGALPWKVIGATATIQDFERQAWELYLKGSRQFPAHGPAADDSFYYRQNPDRCGRIFVGLLGVGRKHTPAVTKALSIFYQQVQKVRELIAQDPVVADATYGTGGLTPQECQQLVFFYELALTYVLTRKGSDQVAEAIESRVRRELQDTCPGHGELLLEMFNGGVDVSHMIATMDELKTMPSNGDPSTRVRGVVTTNIIGHGVDVDRFNVIVFAGFTRLVAEYIQASARVGRRFPGISIFVPTPQSERDRSIFGRFAKFHQYLDRLVDPAAVTRWPLPAMRRTLPGLLCGYLMGVAASKLGKPLYSVEAVRDSQGDFNGEALTQDAVVRWMVDAYGCGSDPSLRYFCQALEREVKNKYSSVVNVPPQRGRMTLLSRHLDSMNSLRDVDEPAFIRIANSDDVKALKRLING